MSIIRTILVVLSGVCFTIVSQGAMPSTENDGSKPVPNSYIIVLNSSQVSSFAEEFRDEREAVSFMVENLLLQHGGELEFIYFHAIYGYSVSNFPDRGVTELQRHPFVSYVEPNYRVIPATGGTQSPVTWGLDRIDQEDLPLDNQFTYPNQAHSRVAYVIDSGIAPHVEFGSRLEAGFSALGGTGAVDCLGHGTHVAGTIAGSTYGVAKSATLVPVRVMDCFGGSDASKVLAGIDWVYSDILDRYSGVFGIHVTAVNLSLQVFDDPNLPPAQAVTDAVTNLENVNAVPVVSAGNSDIDACNVSPAGSDYAITVGATDQNDNRAEWPATGTYKSNYGACVNIFAPGRDITSAYIDNPPDPIPPCDPCHGTVTTSNQQTATATMSGTSMAAPHVAGAVLLYAYEMGAYSYTLASAVRSAIINDATINRITLEEDHLPPADRSPNLLLNISSL